MADNHGVTNPDNGMDYAEHERTYRLFVSLIKSNVIAIVVLLVLMAFFLL